MAGFATLFLQTQKLSNKEVNDLTIAKQPFGSAVATLSGSPCLTSQKDAFCWLFHYCLFPNCLPNEFKWDYFI